MNHSTKNPIEQIAKFRILQNDGIRYYADIISRVKTLAHASQICIKLDTFQKLALIAAHNPCSEERTKTFEHYRHSIDDCKDEMKELLQKYIKDRLVSKSAERYSYR